MRKVFARILDGRADLEEHLALVLARQLAGDDGCSNGFHDAARTLILAGSLDPRTPQGELEPEIARVLARSFAAFLVDDSPFDPERDLEESHALWLAYLRNPRRHDDAADALWLRSMDTSRSRVERASALLDACAALGEAGFLRRAARAYVRAVDSEPNLTVWIDRYLASGIAAGTGNDAPTPSGFAFTLQRTLEDRRFVLGARVGQLNTRAAAPRLLVQLCGDPQFLGQTENETILRADAPWSDCRNEWQSALAVGLPEHLLAAMAPSASDDEVLSRAARTLAIYLPRDERRYEILADHPLLWRAVQEDERQQAWRAQLEGRIPWGSASIQNGFQEFQGVFVPR